MKRLLFLLLSISLLIACNKQGEQTNMAKISGSVEPVINGYFIVSLGPFLDSAKITKDGHFSLSVQVVAPASGMMILKDRFSSLYLEAGKSLNIKIKTNSFPDNTEFSGELGPINHYLQLASKLDKQTNLPEEELYSKNPDDFMHFTDSVENLKMQLLKEYVMSYPGIDTAFIARHKADIHYTWADQRLSYPGNHALLTGKIAPLPDNYHPSYLTDVKLNNPELLLSNSYRIFLEDYLDFKQALYLRDNPQTSKLWFPGSVARFRVIQQEFTDTLVRNYALYTSMNDHLDNFGSDHLETFLTNFQIHCKNEEYISLINKKLDQLKSLERGKPAPVFSAFDPDGKKVSLPDYAGSLIYVNLWASWSQWSIREMPYWENLIKKFEPLGVKFISVSMDFAKDMNKWKYILDKQKLGGIQLIQDPKSGIWQDKYFINDLPRYLLIDAKGNIISVHAPRPSENVAKTLKQLLNKK